MNAMAIVVCHDLDFNVSGLLNEFLQIHGAVAERRLRLGLGRGVSVAQADVVVRNAHPSPAAPGHGLNDHRITNLFRQFQRFFNSVQGALRAWHHRDSCALGGLTCSHLVTEKFHGLYTRPNEMDAAVLTDLSKFNVLSQKAVARMDGLCIGHFSGTDNARYVEIALCALGRTNTHGFIGQIQVR